MEMRGKFKEISKDFITDKVTVSFTCYDVDLAALEKYRDMEKLKITVKQYRKGRSLDANSCYWALVGKIADVLRISKPHTHNILLRRYGQTEMFGEQIAYTMLPDTEETTIKIDNMEEAHFAPTSITKKGKDGVTYRAYKLLQPSHTYDSKQFSILIEGTVDEAKRLGIQTMTPAEIERLVSAWKV